MLPFYKCEGRGHVLSKEHSFHWSSCRGWGPWASISTHDLHLALDNGFEKAQLLNVLKIKQLNFGPWILLEKLSHSLNIAFNCNEAKLLPILWRCVVLIPWWLWPVPGCQVSSRCCHTAAVDTCQWLPVCDPLTTRVTSDHARVLLHLRQRLWHQEHHHPHPQLHQEVGKWAEKASKESKTTSPLCSSQSWQGDLWRAQGGGAQQVQWRGPSGVEWHSPSPMRALWQV